MPGVRSAGRAQLLHRPQHAHDELGPARPRRPPADGPARPEPVRLPGPGPDLSGPGAPGPETAPDAAPGPDVSASAGAADLSAPAAHAVWRRAAPADAICPSAASGRHRLRRLVSILVFLIAARSTLRCIIIMWLRPNLPLLLLRAPWSWCPASVGCIFVVTMVRVLLLKWLSARNFSLNSWNRPIFVCRSGSKW